MGFFFGLVKYIISGADDKEVAKSVMMWSLVALFVMVSVWGIIGLVQDTFGLGSGSAPTNNIIPNFNNSN